jgi:hypothetical protein
VSFSDRGFAFVNGVVFTYVDAWSDVKTWGGVRSPVEGESVSIPRGQSVLIDVQPPKLNLIVVEGTLIIGDSIDLELHANYIMVRNGTLQVGTKSKPLTKSVKIILHGEKYDPSIPCYGNKVIAVREGIIDIHGAPRTVSWTDLKSGVKKGDTQITVLGKDVDWVVGDEIVIAPSGFKFQESETAKIKSIVSSSDITSTTFELETGLKYDHDVRSVTLEGGATSPVVLTTEVGLLTRNVVI